MDYKIIDVHDTEVIRVNDNVKMWYIEFDNKVEFFISVGEIVQTVLKNFYISVKSSGLYPVETTKVYRVLNDNGNIQYDFCSI